MAQEAEKLLPEEVRDYLRHHPDFLSEDGDLLAALVPPERHKAEDPVEDFQRYMLTRLQDHMNAIRDEHNDLLDLMQEHLQRQNRINAAILAALDTDSFEGTISCVTSAWPEILEMASVSLFFEAGPGFPHGFYGGAQVVDEGFADKWLGRDAASLLEEVAEGSPVLFGKDAATIRSHGLVRLHIDDGVPDGLLAFGHADGLYFGTGLATEQIESLGGVLERCLRRWLHQ
jgi:uncharacterized protein YigA (DUF484 family)